MVSFHMNDFSQGQIHKHTYQLAGQKQFQKTRYVPGLKITKLHAQLLKFIIHNIEL